MPPVERLCAGVGGEAHPNSRDQGGIIAAAVMLYAIDEEGRGAIHATADSTHEIAAHLVSVLSRLQSVPQCRFG